MVFILKVSKTSPSCRRATLRKTIQDPEIFSPSAPDRYNLLELLKFSTSFFFFAQYYFLKEFKP